ncbi:MAG: hypothetical protein WBE72_10305, partial [Terracidiphilus sp.]
MRFHLAPTLARAAMVVAFAAPPVTAQTASPQAPAATNPQQGGGKVIFSRSTDENGQTTSSTGPVAAQPAMAAAPIADDAERQAVTFTDYDLDVHLEPALRQIAVRALVTVRNDGQAPLQHIPLEISSSLNWERIRAGGRDAVFQVATLNSDADHTGQLHEAEVGLAEPLKPGASLQLDAIYSGAIAPNAQRLLALGTPEDVALKSDWDEIGVEFTGLRGFGNVVWYPVASVPAMLGNGARLFDEMGAQKLRMEGARFRLRLTDEFPYNQAPTIALINGYPAALTVTGGSEEVPGVATASQDCGRLGFEAPSLFVAIRKPMQAANTTLWTLPADEAAAPEWTAAAAAANPFVESWLGEHARSQLAVLDLPDQEDAPFEAGALLAAPVRPATDERLQGVMVHALAHAFVNAPGQSPPAWLDEGLARFMGTLWLEKRSGRT